MGEKSEVKSVGEGGVSSRTIVEDGGGVVGERCPVADVS